MKKLLTAIVFILSVMTIALGILSSHPVFSCDIEVPETHIQAIKSDAKGLYSNKVPFVPIYVEATAYSDDIVYYTIRYFPFGSVDMSYSEIDGYNIEKQLTKLS